jgi:uncharacterized protein
MKRIMIISDTHKNQVLLRRAFSQEDGITHIFHLGDDYNDLDTNLDLIENKEVFKVPGVYHSGYRNGSIKPTKVATINNWDFTLIHDLYELNSNKLNSSIVFHGHTHKADFREINDIHCINPGHLKDEIDRNRLASYLVVDVGEDKLEFTFKNLDGNIFLKKTIKR